MELSFRIALIIGVLVFLFAIVVMNKRKKLSIRFSIVWLFAGACLLLFAAFPYILFVIRDWLEVEVVSNLVFLIIISFMLLIILGLSSAVSVFTEQIKRLSQSVAILEKRVREIEQSNTTNKNADN